MKWEQWDLDALKDVGVALGWLVGIVVVLGFVAWVFP